MSMNSAFLRILREGADVAPIVARSTAMLDGEARTVAPVRLLLGHDPTMTCGPARPVSPHLGEASQQAAEGGWR
jgi:hypothetical protein